MEAELQTWLNLAQAGEHAAAKSLLDPLIVSSRAVLKKSESSSSENRKNALVQGILSRGLQNLADLLQTISTADWIGTPSLVEQAWTQLWDSADRIIYASVYFSHPTINWGLGQLDRVYREITTYYGAGLYVSPEIVWNRELCSICKHDFRSCEHVRGEIYDGTRCTTSPDGIRIRGTAIVARAADPRCRIWPWQLKEKDGEQIIEGLCLLTSFSLEDFLLNDE